MIWLSELFAGIRDFFEAGGPVLYGVFTVAILMWTMIIERFWYFWKVHPLKVQETVETWSRRQDTSSWHAKRIRERLVSEITLSASQFVPLVRVCVSVAPLLGLLGTVTGMVLVFDIMAALGTGNPRAMAGGVSAATIPTMSGMVTALSGIYFAAALEKKARLAEETIADLLRHHS